MSRRIDKPVAEIWFDFMELSLRRLDADYHFIPNLKTLSARLATASKQRDTNGAKHDQPRESLLISQALLSPKTWLPHRTKVQTYVEALLQSSTIVEPADILSTLLQTRRQFAAEQNSADAGADALGLNDKQLRTRARREEMELRMLNAVARYLLRSADRYPLTVAQGARLLDALQAWMDEGVRESVEKSQSAENPGMEMNKGVLRDMEIRLRETIAVVVIAALGCERLGRLTDRDDYEEETEAFAQQLHAFTKLLSTPNLTLDPQQTQNFLHFCQRIETILKETVIWHVVQEFFTKAKEADASKDDGVAYTAADFQLANVQDLPYIGSRAGNVIWLEAYLLLPFPPTDQAMGNIFHTRSQNDAQQAMIDLVLAAFDLLAMSLHRHDTPNRIFRLRSFTANRLPPLLTFVQSTALQYFDMEFTISSAFSRIDPSLFSGGFHEDLDGAGNQSLGNVLSGAKSEFLLSCAVHGLIQESAVERLGGMPSAVPIQKKRVETLVQEYNSGQLAEDKLVGGMEAMDGNAGAFVAAGAQVLQGMCTAKDTSSLRTMSILLCRSWKTLVAMSLFVDWRTLLRPVCEMLNDWNSEGHQGEYQPVYDEFSSCLLLVMSCTNLFNLSPVDLGIDSTPDNFVRELLLSGSNSMSQSDISPDQDKLLGIWIKALFETESISDDVMSACPPQVFYKLVPTLVRQSIFACRTEMIKEDRLRNGLELLLETFSMPSLVFAIRWLCSHIWESHGDLALCLSILSKWIRPNSLEGDKQPMHEAVLNIVREPLIAMLLRRSNTPETSKTPLLNDLLGELQKQPVSHSNYLATAVEVRNWTTGSADNPMMAYKGSLNLLCFWSSAGGMPSAVGMSSLPHYTIRHTLLTVRHFGASRVLATLVEEVIRGQHDGFADVALDAVTTILCTADLWNKMPVPESMLCARALQTKSNMTLRQALEFEMSDARKLITTDKPRAEVLKRLTRRLELYSVNPPLAGEVQLPIADVMSLDLNQTMDLATAAVQQPAHDDTGMDFSTADAGLGLDIESALADTDDPASHLPPSANPLTGAEDDIFAGLEVLDVDMMDFA